jgi:hypothetical protein
MRTDRGFAPEIRSKAAKEQRAPHHLAFGLMPQIAACLRHLPKIPNLSEMNEM